MTAENKALGIAEELDRARKALASADVLHANNLGSDAISRLYYCLLYHMRALLLEKGLEPKSHEAALRLFSLHYVKEGIFKPADAHLFSRLQKYRAEADYNPSYTFSPEDYMALRAETEALNANVVAYLRSKGFAGADSA